MYSAIMQLIRRDVFSQSLLFVLKTYFIFGRSDFVFSKVNIFFSVDFCIPSTCNMKTIIIVNLIYPVRVRCVNEECIRETFRVR